MADLVNGAFELLAGLFTLLNVRRLRKDRSVRGVSIIPTVFFTAWGFWNMYYYPSLDQWASFVGGIAVVSVNMVWVVLAVHYMRKEKGERG